ncbi:hypothetical protein ACJX0J_009748 [Zea mays]
MEAGLWTLEDERWMTNMWLRKKKSCCIFLPLRFLPIINLESDFADVECELPNEFASAYSDVHFIGTKLFIKKEQREITMHKKLFRQSNNLFYVQFHFAHKIKHKDKAQLLDTQAATVQACAAQAHISSDSAPNKYALPVFYNRFIMHDAWGEKLKILFSLDMKDMMDSTDTDEDTENAICLQQSPDSQFSHDWYDNKIPIKIWIRREIGSCHTKELATAMRLIIKLLYLSTIFSIILLHQY